MDCQGQLPIGGLLQMTDTNIGNEVIVSIASTCAAPEFIQITSSRFPSHLVVPLCLGR